MGMFNYIIRGQDIKREGESGGRKTSDEKKEAKV